MRRFLHVVKVDILASTLVDPVRMRVIEAAHFLKSWLGHSRTFKVEKNVHINFVK